MYKTTNTEKKRILYLGVFPSLTCVIRGGKSVDVHTRARSPASGEVESGCIDEESLYTGWDKLGNFLL